MAFSLAPLPFSRAHAPGEDDSRHVASRLPGDRPSDERRMRGRATMFERAAAQEV
jgi:hypothetical protein